MPFSWRIAQTLGGVIGMSMLRTPRCHRGSTTALAIDGDEAADLHLARALVDVDDADIAAERERQVRRVVIVDRLEARLHAGWMVGVGREGDLLDRLLAVRRAFDVELAGRPLEVLLGRLEEMRRELPRLVADLAGGNGGRRSRHRCRSRRVGAEPIGRGVGVAVLDLDVGDGEPELLGDDLGEGGLVTLALGLDADPGEALAGGM